MLSSPLSSPSMRSTGNSSEVGVRGMVTLSKGRRGEAGDLAYHKGGQ